MSITFFNFTKKDKNEKDLLNLNFQLNKLI